MSDPEGSIPQTGEYIEFGIGGGDPPYNYTVREITQGFIGDAITRVVSGTTNKPRIEFPFSDDGKTFRIEITDSSSECVKNYIDFTPNYPHAPIIDDSTSDINVCNGDDVLLSITPVLTSGQTLSDFEYSFDGGNIFQGGNTLVVNLGVNLSENFDLVLKDKQTQCKSSKTVTVTQSILEISTTIFSLGDNDATIYFEINTNENLEFIEVSISDSFFPISDSFVSPSANNTDRYSRFGDSDFPELSPGDSSNLFAITGVEFGTSVIISVISSVSNCLGSNVAVNIPFNPVFSIDDIEVEGLNKNSFYPNPVKGQAFFETEIEKIEIFNLQGAIIRTEYNVKEIDLKFIQKGVYFIHIYKLDKIQSIEKLLKE